MSERLPSLKAREVIRALERAGFHASGTVQGILRQAGLAAEEFKALLRD